MKQWGKQNKSHTPSCNSYLGNCTGSWVFLVCWAVSLKMFNLQHCCSSLRGAGGCVQVHGTEHQRPGTCSWHSSAHPTETRKANGTERALLDRDYFSPCLLHLYILLCSTSKMGKHRKHTALQQAEVSIGMSLLQGQDSNSIVIWLEYRKQRWRNGHGSLG